MGHIPVAQMSIVGGKTHRRDTPTGVVHARAYVFVLGGVFTTGESAGTTSIACHAGMLSNKLHSNRDGVVPSTARRRKVIRLRLDFTGYCQIWPQPCVQLVHEALGLRSTRKRCYEALAVGRCRALPERALEFIASSWPAGCRPYMKEVSEAPFCVLKCDVQESVHVEPASVEEVDLMRSGWVRHFQRTGLREFPTICAIWCDL